MVQAALDSIQQESQTILAHYHELQYLASHFSDIDANIPFQKGDDFIMIANKIAQLQQETISDTLSLIQRDAYIKASQYIEQAKRIVLFASSNVISLCEEFIYEMNRINRSVEFICSDGEQMFRAYNCSEEDCAIIVSYTGETDIILVISDILKKRNVPVIALTSIGENTLAHHANVTLFISTREKQYSKIASFSINTSIRLQLSILYSCVFSLHYDEHMQYRIENAKRIETPQTRTSHFSLIKEEEK